MRKVYHVLLSNSAVGWMLRYTYLVKSEDDRENAERSFIDDRRRRCGVVILIW